MLSASMFTSVAASMRMSSSFLVAGVVLAASLKASFEDLTGKRRLIFPALPSMAAAPDADSEEART